MMFRAPYKIQGAYLLQNLFGNSVGRIGQYSTYTRLSQRITGLRCVSATEGLGYVPGRYEAGTSEYTRAGESGEEVTAFSYSGYAFNVAHEPFDVRLWPSRIRALDDSLLICEEDQPVVRELVLKILVLVGRCLLDYKSKMLV